MLLALVGGNGFLAARKFGVDWDEITRWVSRGNGAAAVAPDGPSRETPADAGAPTTAAGKAPAATPKGRPFLSVRDTLAAVRQHLQNTPLDDRKFQRYFSLAHVHNNPRRTDAEVDLHRKALGKLLAQFLVNKEAGPEPVDPARTVFAVDLRALGWEKDHRWRELLKAYPYGLKRSEAQDADVAALAGEVYDLAVCEVPIVHGDWLIATASEGPLRAALSKGAASGAPAPEIEQVRALYRQAVGASEVALELGLADGKQVQEFVRGNDRLGRLGLGPLARGETIERQTWDSLDGSRSRFQRLARELDLGTPYRVLD
jgi:hypothetical protein